MRRHHRRAEYFQRRVYRVGHPKMGGGGRGPIWANRCQRPRSVEEKVGAATSLRGLTRTGLQSHSPFTGKHSDTTMQVATLIRHLSTLLLATTCTAPGAEVVSVNYLTRDTQTYTIVDSLNNRTWLGWEASKGLTYLQLLDSLAPGGTLGGWKLASNLDAVKFLEALSGGANPCTIGAAAFPVCNTGLQAAERVVGETSIDYFSQGYDFDTDMVMFNSMNGQSHDIGLINVVTSNTIYETTRTFLLHDWCSLACADAQQQSYPHSLSWLLYHESASVSEPSTLLLTLASALALLRSRLPRHSQTSTLTYSLRICDRQAPVRVAA